MVSSVNYSAGAPQYSSFQELVNRPQTYAEKPVASTGISGQKKKGKAGKIILGTAATAAAVAGTLVLTKKFNPQIKAQIAKIPNLQIKTNLNIFADKASNWGSSIELGLQKAGHWLKTGIEDLPAKINQAIEWGKNKINGLRTNTTPPSVQ